MNEFLKTAGTVELVRGSNESLGRVAVFADRWFGFLRVELGEDDVLRLIDRYGGVQDTRLVKWCDLQLDPGWMDTTKHMLKRARYVVNDVKRRMGIS